MSASTERPTPERAPAPEPVDQLVVTEHTLTAGGRTLRYTVTAGSLVLREELEKKGDDEGAAEGAKPRATVFFTAYTLDDADDAAHRPVTFAFNGGPGSSSVWLHMGALGPRRVEMGDAGALLPPPWALVDNPDTLLFASDLVFIDPVSTGYSRPVTGEKAKVFHNLKKDVESVGDFIRLWTTRNRRWASPKYLAGESYGTTRSAALSGYLADRHGLVLNGIMLISAVLDFQTLEFLPSNDLPYILYVPSYTATAWYHGRLAPELQRDLKAALAEAEAFALGAYATALLRGAALPAAERRTIAAQLARLIGLAPEFVERCDLRVELGRFTKELLRERGLVAGRLDSRFTGVDRDTAGERPESDPSMNAILGPYTAVFNEYVRGELGWESDLPYEVLSLKTNENWRFPEHENRYVEVAETLRSAIAANPHLRVLVANGRYDLATPYLATEHTFHHLGLAPGLQGNVTMTYYEAGHMMYLHLPSLAQLNADLTAFVRGTSGASA